MKYLILTMILVASCHSPYFKAAEDALIGECQVAEKVMEDLSGAPTTSTRPSVNVIKSSF